MRQEGQSGNNGNQLTGSGPGSGNGGGGGNGMPSILSDSNLPHQTSLDDMHQHLHSQTSQTLNFGDIY